jgi:hypothetical protein
MCSTCVEAWITRSHRDGHLDDRPLTEAAFCLMNVVIYSYNAIYSAAVGAFKPLRWAITSGFPVNWRPVDVG